MRLDFFLPLLGRPRRGAARVRSSLAVRAARAVLPRFLFSDLETGRPGLLRRALSKLGPSWLFSPIRRVVQVGCLVLFCVLFFHVCWPYTAEPGAHRDGWPSHYTEDLAAKEWVEAEVFLALDPLASISTAIAARAWVWSLTWAGVIIAVCVLVPRGFCGYLCPLGTLIDAFDWAVGRRVKRSRANCDRAKRRGWWVNLKYYLLLGTLVGALFGVLLSGFVAAVPVITRGFQFVISPLQTGLLRGWHQVPPVNVGHYVSIALFVAVLGLGLLRPRFWCRYVCPSGAVFSVSSLFLRATERKVEDSCIRCGKCGEVCPFDAVKADFTTRVMDCTLCQTCGGVCPTRSIKFVGRWDAVALKPEGDAPLNERPLTRRGFLVGTLSGFAAALGVGRAFGANLMGTDPRRLPVRPPGTVPERDFLRLCIRCGECFKVCPNGVLQPAGFEQGIEGLWTPRVAADWSGCEASCTNCGQVCPTGAIRALTLREKRVARMGLALVDERKCLPWAKRADCRLCVEECQKAGYHALEFERIGVQVDDDGMPLPDTGFPAPVVIAERCVGCGLCQSICSLRNVKDRGLLEAAAVTVEAGPGREDRIMTGSYMALRAKEAEARRKEEEKRRKELEDAGFGDFY